MTGGLQLWFNIISLEGTSKIDTLAHPQISNLRFWPRFLNHLSFPSNIQLAIFSEYLFHYYSPSLCFSAMRCRGFKRQFNSCRGGRISQYTSLAFEVHSGQHRCYSCRFEILIKINSDVFQALVSKPRSFSTFQKAPTPNEVYEIRRIFY